MAGAVEHAAPLDGFERLAAGGFSRRRQVHEAQGHGGGPPSDHSHVDCLHC